MIEFRMPSLGADMEDGVMVEWRVAPGDAVARGQVVGVVETQKGAIEIEIWDAGTVAQLIAAPGQRIPVGQVLATLAGDGEDWQAVAVASAAPPAAAADGAPPRPLPPTGATRPAGRPRLPPRASPAARRRAGELGIDLDALAASLGTAPISIADVERAAASPPAAPVSVPAATGTATPASTPTPAEAMRAAIAAAMARSRREIPHYYLATEADVDAAHESLERFNAAQPVTGRVLFAALALRALAQALREAPELNGQFVGGRFRPSSAIHVGVVTSLRGGGIVVPAVHDVDRLTLPQTMAALRDVLARARAGRLRSSDLADSTITLTNLGDLGVETVFGVIYPPQVALVGLGRVGMRPVARDGNIVAARTMTITLAGDHRVSDGLTGARFLAALRARLEHPETT